MKCYICLRENKTVKEREGIELCDNCYTSLNGTLKEIALQNRIHLERKRYKECIHKLIQRRKSNGRHNL